MHGPSGNPSGFRPALELAALVVVGHEVLDHRVGAAGLNSFDLFSRDNPDQVRILPHVLLGSPCVRMANQVESGAEQHVVRDVASLLAQYFTPREVDRAIERCGTQRGAAGDRSKSALEGSHHPEFRCRR